jgi:thiamine phosphate synthase YjbQ (UPF0047 family)
VTVQQHSGAAVSRPSAIISAVPEVIATATLCIATRGQGFTEFTREAARFLVDAAAKDGGLQLFVRHTSASLVIQENADPDVQTDLVTALVKAMITGVSLYIPVIGGALALGTWQGLYLAEHRAHPHRREVVLQFIGSRR